MLAGIVIVPGAVALLLLLVFSYLYRQSRDPFFHFWQRGWAAYCMHFVLLIMYFVVDPDRPWMWGATFCFTLLAWQIYRSSDVLRHETRRLMTDVVMVSVGALTATLEILTARSNGLTLAGLHIPRGPAEVWIAGVMLVAAVRFQRTGHRRSSLGLKLAAGALVFWAALLSTVPFHQFMPATMITVGHFLGPMPQMILGIALVVTLFENERRSVQDNLLAFSSLEIDTGAIHAPQEIVPNIEALLARLLKLLGVERAALLMRTQWQSVVPSVERGLGQDLLRRLEGDGLTDFVSDVAYRRGGLAVFDDLEDPGRMLNEQSGNFERLRSVLQPQDIEAVTVVSLQTRDRCFGAIVFPSSAGQLFGASQLRLLLGLAMQIGLTLENYVLMHDAQRRTKEYELLTQVGQVISSRLDADEVLLAIQRELGLLFDTSNFYIAFLDDDLVRFELEVINNHLEPKRTRPAVNMFTEYVIRSGQPLLVTADIEKTRQRLGCIPPQRPAKCIVMVPIVMYGRPAGVMAALNYEHEYVYSERDLEVMTTAAGQVAVAMENARLFAEEQRRARYLAFLNNISKTAISSQNADQMLAEIVGEIQKNFKYCHIGIGILDYATKDIEIKAEAGTTARALGRRVPLGAGLVGRVARSNEMALVQNTSGDHPAALLEDSKSVLCIPIAYGESMLGVLNVESRQENAFGQQEVLILRTLADLLATALHNAYVFQKLQQQSITDGLTGIKTRRFFLEALQSEWKRASRSGRPFSVVLADLDKFKEVNDGLGHLEGDLVLARVGRLLEQKCRQSNVVARYGGDEFVILMPETTLDQAQVLSERLRLWLATDPMLNERHITGSFGVATFPLHGATAEDVLRVADAGMYVSKHGGGNRVATVEELAATAASHRQIVTAYIEGFLQREHTGPELIDELSQILKKLSSAVKEDQQEEIMQEAVLALTRAAETREMHAAGHGEAVARIADVIVRELDLPSVEQRDIVFAARVHDVGKILIPEKILNKTVSLTQEDRYLVRMHAQLGAQIVGTLPGAARMEQYVRHHHERFDGDGYPNGLRGDAIPLGARIVAVAETYANMTLERPYAPARSSGEALRELENCSGTQLDGMVVRTLTRALREERLHSKS